MLFNKEWALSSSQRSAVASWRLQDGCIDVYAKPFIQNASYVMSCSRVEHRKLKNTMPLNLQHHHPDNKFSGHHRIHLWPYWKFISHKHALIRNFGCTRIHIATRTQTTIFWNFVSHACTIRKLQLRQSSFTSTKYRSISNNYRFNSVNYLYFFLALLTFHCTRIRIT